ncbi:MAG: glycosyltransferase [Planctomycetales bacterium]
MEPATLPTASTPESNSAPRIKVVHLVLSLNIGGLEKVVYDLVRFTDTGRFDIEVLCLDSVGALGPAFEQLGVRVEGMQVRGRGLWGAIRAMASRLRQMRPDVLHTHNQAPHAIGAPAAWWAGVKAVVHTRHGRHTTSGWKQRLSQRIADKLTQRVVAVSGDAARISLDGDRIPQDKVEVIHNGIDLQRFSAPDRTFTTTCYQAIHVARLNDPIKDQQSLLRAARLVADADPSFTLAIVGDGPDRGLLEALCDELSLRSHVTFLGDRHDVPELLGQARMFVLSSITEGLSISLLEAMACGLAVVATDVGGNAEVIQAGETGFLTPPRSPERLAAEILKLLRDPQLCLRMGRAGRRRVEEHFDLRAVAARYEQIYQHLLRR